MGNPLRRLAGEFVRGDAETWLIVGIIIAVTQALAAFYAARAEDVLTIPGGVGLFQNYGLLANLIANACFPYLARRFYEEVMKLAGSETIEPNDKVQHEIVMLRSLACAESKAVYVFYLFCFLGMCFWLANTSIHVFGSAERYWGHRVFDSPDHPWSFAVNRINNFYSWVVLLPLCAHMLIWASIELRRIVRAAVREGAATFDILNADGTGGYLAIENAKVIFNLILAAIYVDISLHTGTFRVIHFDHALAYASATIILLFGNMLVFREINKEIKKLRNAAISARKSKAYENDTLSFEILKHFYGVRPPRRIQNFLIQSVPVAGSLALKAAPLLTHVDAFQSLR